MQKKPYWIGSNIVFDLSPLIDAALRAGDKEYFRELVCRNKLYWRLANVSRKSN
jgi:hypothetical protein